ncbi:MAG: hypothetical protein AAGF11_18965 [Myxococcota bacterium]
MRYGILGCALMIGLGTACFDAPPSTGNGASSSSSTTGSCPDGQEGCACVEGQCLSGLVCLSMLCVAPSESSSTTVADDTTGSGSATETAGTTTPVTTAATTETPADTGTSGVGVTGTGPGPVDPCDPLLQDCVADEACTPVDDGFGCTPAGMGGLGASCDVEPCAAGFVCITGEAIACMGAECCTYFCDLSDPDGCPGMLMCAPWFPAGPPPGYEDVGACVAN